MTVQAWEARRRTGRYRRVLIAALAVAILVPLGVLFFSHNRHQGERQSMATEERHGVAYLLALSELTIELTGAQSAAVSGEPVRQEELDEAVAHVAEVDGQYGDQLRVGERWSQLREMIEQITTTDHADGRAAYTSYEEATGLLLGLHDRLRDVTGLVRDPDADTYHLQEAAGGALPATIVASGRLVDLATIAAAGPADDPATATDLPAAVAAVTSPADALVIDVQAALDATESGTLSSTVLGKYDRFLRAKDALLGAVPADGEIQEGGVEMLVGIRGELHTAAEALSTALLSELDRLIGNRASDLTRDRWIAVTSAVVSMLLVLAVLALSLVGPAGLPIRRPHQDELPGGDGRGSGAARGTPELPLARRSISDTAAGYEARSGTPAAADRLSGDVLSSERADVR